MDETLAKKILDQGMSVDIAEEQLKNFREGFPFLPIARAATIGDGIHVLSDEKIEELNSAYQKKSKDKKIVKFVPASGAATRMFKDLFAFLDGDGNIEGNKFVQKFIDQINDFAFYADLNESLKNAGSSIEDALAKKDYQSIVKQLLADEGLGYGNLPKGLLKFHSYADHQRTPAQEHLIEGVQYGLGAGQTVRIHFTVSPEHEEKFRALISAVQPKLEAEHGVKYDISYSQQKKSTDTIAVDMDNQPFEEEDGSILFRPAGHGALLENLNDIEGDIIFIKNVDNVVPDRLKGTTKDYKMALAAMLIEVQEKVFAALTALESRYSESSLAQAELVATQDLGVILPGGFSSLSLEEKGKYLQGKLNKPIRVCGMVKNTGEPGGGPFWVKEDDGSLSLQIAETAQIDLDNPDHKSIFQSSTHFNPVDLVCATKDYKGQAFDLLKYRDMRTGFITEKSKSGRALKAQELPGLWNGSMAGWNTIFVEVPLITFNPVKTVNDLLRDEHQ